MKQTSLIYQLRQVLQRSENRLPARITHALAAARARAVDAARGAGVHGRRPMPWRSLDRNWAVGISLASLASLVVGLALVREVSIERDIARLAEIDRKVITARLPVQAYLDPGFLVFQETQAAADAGASSAPTEDSLSRRAEIALKEFWSLQTLFPGLTESDGLAWQRLSAAQQQALHPLESLWTDMTYSRKRKWLKIADRFGQMSAEEQQLAHDRMQEWVSLPASERRQARAAFGGVQDTTPQDVQVMKWNEYQRLSAKERARLMELAQQRASEGSNTESTPRKAPSALAPQAAKPLISND